MQQVNKSLGMKFFKALVVVAMRFPLNTPTQLRVYSDRIVYTSNDTDVVICSITKGNVKVHENVFAAMAKSAWHAVPLSGSTEYTVINDCIAAISKGVKV